MGIQARPAQASSFAGPTSVLPGPAPVPGHSSKPRESHRIRPAALASYPSAQHTAQPWGAHRSTVPKPASVLTRPPLQRVSAQAQSSHSTTGDALARAYLKRTLALNPGPEVDLSRYHVTRDLEPNVQLLLQIQSPQRCAALLRAHWELLGVPLTDWRDFLQEYGVSPHFFFKLLSSHTRLFTHGSLYTAGQAMLLLQGLGLTTRDISAHIIPRAADLLYQPHLITQVSHFLTAPPEPQSGVTQPVAKQRQPQPATAATGVPHAQSSRPQPAAAATAATDGLHSSSQAMQTAQSSLQPQPVSTNAPTDLAVSFHASQAQSSSSQVQDTVEYGLGLDKSELRSLLSRCPRLLLLSVSDHLRPRLHYLRHTAGFTADEVESHLTFLTREAGFSHTQAKTLLVMCADLLVFSIGNLERKWSFLTTQIFSGATQTAMSAFQAPATQGAAHTTQSAAHTTQSATQTAMSAFQASTTTTQAQSEADTQTQSNATRTAMSAQGHTRSATATTEHSGAGVHGSVQSSTQGSATHSNSQLATTDAAHSTDSRAGVYGSQSRQAQQAPQSMQSASEPSSSASQPEPGINQPGTLSPAGPLSVSGAQPPASSQPTANTAVAGPGPVSPAGPGDSDTAAAHTAVAGPGPVSPVAGPLSVSDRARAAVLSYPRYLTASLINDIGPRFSYARDRGLLGKLLEYEEQSGTVSFSLARMLDCDQIQYLVRVGGEETDFETYCANWRRTQAATITFTAINPSEASW